MSTISVEKEELRAIVREAVKRKFAALKEAKAANTAKEPAPKSAVRKPVVSEAQRLQKAREALLVLLESMGMTPTGSSMGGSMGSPAEPINDTTATPMGEAGKPAGGNETEAQELVIFIENDEELWSGQKAQIEKNLAKRMQKGTYQPEFAIKSWALLADMAAKKYMRVYGGDAASGMFNKETRMMAAKELAKAFEDEMQSGEKSVESILGGAQ